MSDVKEIVIGILKRAGQVCVSLRQDHQSFANCWEFAGGKIEAGEGITEALIREVQEELAVFSQNWVPLIVIPWRYESVSVRLNVFVTEDFTGEPAGNEGQKVKWVPIEELSELNFPEANKGIINALRLPHNYMISGRFETPNEGLLKLNLAFDRGVKFCQLRAKGMLKDEFIHLAKKSVQLTHDHGGLMLLNGEPSLLDSIPEADGIQLASNALFEYDSRPIAANKWLGASTHNQREIGQALRLGADFILLSPVKETQSHPGVSGIGWQEFEALVANIPVPVFALGGMKPSDSAKAKSLGGQGIAAISGFWPTLK